MLPYTLLRTRVSAVPSVYYKLSFHKLIVESPSLYQVPFNKLLLLIPTLNLRRQINSLPRPLPLLVTSSPYFHHWLVNFHPEYSITAQSTFPYVHRERQVSPQSSRKLQLHGIHWRSFFYFEIRSLDTVTRIRETLTPGPSSTTRLSNF